MKSVTRWIVVIAAIALIALLLWLLTQRGEQPAPTDTGALQAPASPAPPPAPAPKPVEPVTATTLFDYNRAALRPTDAARLDELAGAFAAGGYQRIDAVGHADRIGSEAYNQALSLRRGEAVQAYLLTRGVDAVSVRIEAAGESQAVTGDTCRKMGAENRSNRRLIECLQPDRRVQVTLVPAR